MNAPTVQQRQCKVEGCQAEFYGRGLCNKHWYRWRVNGDPLKVRRRRGSTNSFVRDEVGHIELTKRYYATVDEKHFSRLNEFKWQVISHRGGKLYATRRIRLANGKSKFRQMHHDVLPPLPGFEVDHADRDGLNNREGNLRYVSSSQNKQNRDKQANNRSGYKGVFWSAQKGKWQAVICDRGRRYHLGFFQDPRDGSRAYNAKARELGWIYVPADPV